MHKSKKTILLVEDSSALAQLYDMFMQQAGYQVIVVATGQAALAQLEKQTPSAVVLDLLLPDMNGLDILDHLQNAAPHIPVIVATVTNSADIAVEAMRRGAYDYIIKPLSATRLTVTLNNALERGELAHEVTEWRQACGQSGFHHFVGQCGAMQAVYRIIDAVARSNAGVFILGENGTGKELAARAIHDISPRAGRPFLAINCAAVPANLMESLLFGHVRGAFTGATQDQDGIARSAHGGTLLLDEICELPLELQSKLLRFVQTGEIMPVGSQQVDHVDVRILCATNRNPFEEVKARRFREDLYYRLNIVSIEMPSLREREEDIVILANHFIARLAAEENKIFTGLAPEVIKLFRGYEWPGNVRQLENILRHIIVLNDGPIITAAMLPGDLRHFTEANPVIAANQNAHDLYLAPHPDTMPIKPLWLTEKQTIQQALAATGHDVPRAAAILEISASTIYRKLLAWNTENQLATH